ncbi:hypothetical protein CEXT_356741 [Caerostris extrusa]|uniref:Uncharacterized protein n=1 Tax=Caerostris extrusa TaxID=172846 RepID=A0AAV4Y677_CAEEX|nr:hypothetical protein CEXT_356741 [Caerostris extrusa]
MYATFLEVSEAERLIKGKIISEGTSKDHLRKNDEVKKKKKREGQDGRGEKKDGLELLQLRSRTSESSIKIKSAAPRCPALVTAVKEPLSPCSCSNRINPDAQEDTSRVRKRNLSQKICKKMSIVGHRINNTTESIMIHKKTTAEKCFRLPDEQGRLRCKCNLASFTGPSGWAHDLTLPKLNSSQNNDRIVHRHNNSIYTRRKTEVRGQRRKGKRTEEMS